MSDATRLLAEMEHDPQAAAKLLPLVYEELRRIARTKMLHERGEHTLQATALVHEAYLRLIDGEPARWDSRRHFFAAAAEAMRRILIDHARRKNCLKQGGGRERVELDEDLPEIQSPCADVADLLALDSAMNRLAAEHPEQAELIKLIYFAGLSLEDAGAAMGLSKTAAHRQALFARAWLFDAMERSDV